MRHLVLVLVLTVGVLPDIARAAQAAEPRAAMPQAESLSVTSDQDAAPRTQRPYRCGLGPMLVLVFMPVLLVAAVLGILLVRSLLQWRTANDSGEAISPLAADHIARAARQRAASASVAMLVGVASAWAFGHSLLAALIAFFASIPLGDLLAARRVLRELDRERARAELRGTVLIVRSPNGQARLATSRRVIDRGLRHAVPISIAR